MVDFTGINERLKKNVGDIADSIRGVNMNGEKIVDQFAVNELFALLEEVRIEVQNSQKVDKDFVALLFYLYSTICSETGYTDFPEPLFRLTGKLEQSIVDLFGQALQG